MQERDGVFGNLERCRGDIDRLSQITGIDVPAVIVMQPLGRIDIGVDRDIAVPGARPGHDERCMCVGQRGGNRLATWLQQHQRPGQQPHAEHTVHPPGARNKLTETSHDLTSRGLRPRLAVG